MDINNKPDTINNDKLPILRSTSKETRNRFDNLLKNALNQKNETRKTSVSPTKFKINTNNIFEKHTDEKNEENETTTTSTEEIIDDAKNTESTQNDVSKENYILEKFLSDATSIKQDDKAFTPELPLTSAITYIKPPVPLPRNLRNKLTTDESSSSSNRTYSIASPKINAELLKDIDRLSISSVSTYNIVKVSKDSLLPPSPSPINKIMATNATTTTRLRHQVSAVGDIIIHRTGTSVPSKKVVNIIEHKIGRKVSTKIDVSKLQPNEIQEIIDSKYKEIEKRRNTESCSGKDDTLVNIEEDLEMMAPSVSTSKLRSESDTLGGIKPYNYENLIGVAVYRCDKLLLNSHINQPCVKVHIVDSGTGKYLRRSSRNEVEARDLTTAHVYPLITKAYNMQEKRSLVPNWEEILIFDEDFDYMMDYENPVVVFFEILDFLSFSDANTRYNAEGSFSGWHKIAWAFLRLIGKGYLNVEQKLRLQLYKPKKTILLKSSKECILYDWWKNGELIKYPSSIHVCVKRVKNMNQENMEKIRKKNMNTHEPDVDVELEKDSGDTYSEQVRPKCKIKWTKKSSHSCKVPTKILSEYKTSDKGCFLVRFSNDGYLLAAAIATLTKYPIYVYSIADSNIYCKFEGHRGLIYDLNWSDKDVYLISAASDCTICIWNVLTKEYYPLQTLPHPSFVYCVSLKVLENTEIITGCYDKILRVWRADNKVNIGTNYDLKQELEGHTGYITSICSRRHENILYSSDSLGVVIQWIFDDEKWTLTREFKFKEYLNTIINKIILHPKSERLFVFCRDSTIRLLDLNVNCIVQWYKGALNDRLLLTGCVTPCGTSVFSSSEDGTICIWNANTGILRGTYYPYMNKYKVLTIPYCIEYHPFDHIVTFCHYGSLIPIILCIYHRSFMDADLQFTNLEEPSTVVKTDKRPRKYKKKRGHESLKKNTDINLGTLGSIIDKIDDVLVSAKTL